MKHPRGAALVETALFLLFVMFPLFVAHFAIIAEWRRRLEGLDALRLKYDGVIVWRP
jgi:hypothetical protein